MKLNYRSFSLRLLLAFVFVCALFTAFYARYKRMNTPHPLIVKHRIDHEWGVGVEASIAPVFFLNPPRARNIAKHYKAGILARLNATPPERLHYNPALRLLVRESPEVLPTYFEKWFSPETPIQTLVDGTQIVFQTGHAAGIEKAKQEILRRFRTVEDTEEACKLCNLAYFDSELWPSVKQLLNRLSGDPKVVMCAIGALDASDSCESLELDKVTIELLKSWLENGTEGQRYQAVKGLSYTPFRESEVMGDQIRSRIANGDRLFHGAQTILGNNPAPWVLDALADLRNGVDKQNQFTEIVCKFGGEESVEFFQSRIRQLPYASNELRALRRVVGLEKTKEFLRNKVDNNLLHLNGIMLDVADEGDVDAYIKYLTEPEGLRDWVRDQPVISDFVDFLNKRQDTPIDLAPLGLSALESMRYGGPHGLQQYMLHKALLESSLAMELDQLDWLSKDGVYALYHELILLTDGAFVPDGIRVEEGLVEISWKNIVFVEQPRDQGPALGLVEMLNAILDHSGETDARFVTYFDEDGNEMHNIAFLSPADAKILETQFGFKPSVANDPDQ